MTSSNTGVQFLQLLEHRAFPVNVAYADGAAVKLVPASGGVAANVSVMDARTDLALMYLQAGRVDDAVATLEFAGPIAEHAACTDDVAVAVVAVQTLFAAGRSEAGDVASRLARRHPGVADFHILVAETAAARGDERLALDSLAELQHVGLPLLYRSFALALRRLETTAMRGYAHATDPGGVAAVHARLQELAPNVDVASRLLVVPTARLEQPNWTPSAVRRWVIRWVKSSARAPLREIPSRCGGATHQPTREDILDE